MYPSVSDSAVKNHPEMLKGVSQKTARAAGNLRGAAAQQRHFAEVYGSTAKVVNGMRTPSAIVAGAGAGGLAAARVKEADERAAARAKKQSVGKSHDPLTSTEIKQKKKTQSKVAQTTGALALGGLGAFTASKLPNSTRAVKAVPRLKKINQKKAENVALGLSTTSGGIGGVGSFNFAQYTKAEAERGKVRKSATTSAFGVDHD